MTGKIEIPQFPELSFNEFNHTYRLDELIIPSVTTLMKPLSDDFYRAVDPEVLEKAAKRGTAIHNAVENFAQFGIEDIPPAYAGYFQAFRTWWELRQRHSTDLTNPCQDFQLDRKSVV